MRTLDQGETAATQRQHAPIGPIQPVAWLDLRIAEAGFTSDPRRDLCKLAALQGLQQIARVSDATTVFAREPLIKQPLPARGKRRANLEIHPCWRDRLGCFRDELPVKPCRASGAGQRFEVLPRQHGHPHRTLQPAHLLEARRTIEMIRPQPPSPIGQPFGQPLPPHRL
jgi:hypothetical protein